jgi:hypothetical protein
MPTHLATEAEDRARPRARLAGAAYHGAHRSAAFWQHLERGALVFEPDSPVPSIVIAMVDDRSAVVRHVGACDDHRAGAYDLKPFTEGNRAGVWARTSGAPAFHA